MKSCFQVVSMDCSLLILFNLLTIYLGVINSAISEDDLAFELVSKSNLFDLQPQSSKFAVLMVGKFKRGSDVCMFTYLQGLSASTVGLDYGDLKEILCSCMLEDDFEFVTVTLRFWKAFLPAFRWTRISLLTLIYLDSIIIQIFPIQHYLSSTNIHIALKLISKSRFSLNTHQSIYKMRNEHANRQIFIWYSFFSAQRLIHLYCFHAASSFCPALKIKNYYITTMTFAMHQVKLPHNFADKVLQLESLLDDSLSMDLITDLNELYRIGIDYYIQFQPRKAQHFQRKMTKLLADPATLNLIESRSPSKVSHLRSPHLATKSKISHQVARFTTCSQEYVKNMIQQSEKTIKKNEVLKNTDLNKQEQELQNRIMLKKYKSQEKFMRFKGD